MNHPDPHIVRLNDQTGATAAAKAMIERAIGEQPDAERIQAERDYYHEAWFEGQQRIRSLVAEVAKLRETLRKFEEYEEKRPDGKVVSKGRWEMGLRRIVHIFEKAGDLKDGTWEIEDVVALVQKTKDKVALLEKTLLERIRT